MKKSLVVLMIALAIVSLFVGCKKDPKVTAPADVTVTYKFGDKEYTVKKSPSEIAGWDGTLEDGTKWTKEGYVLDGWYSAENGAGTYYTPTSSISDGATLYPHWVDENLSFKLVEGKKTYSASVNNDKKDTVTSVTIPEIYHGEKVTQIGDFSECGELKEVAFEEPENIDSICDSAFSFCEKLESINLSKTKITKIGQEAFNRCLVLPTVKLPSTLTSIGMYAFYQCKKLAEIELPESLTEIGYEAFSESGLVSITIPKNVTVLGASEDEGSAFYKCTSLKTVEIEEGLTTLSKAKYALYVLSNNFYLRSPLR